MSSWQDFRQKLEAAPEFAEEYRRQFPYESYAVAVARLRAEHDLTQQAFAERVGLTQAQVSNIESGTHKPNIGHLERIAAAFGLRGSFRFCSVEAADDTAEQLTFRTPGAFEYSDVRRRPLAPMPAVPDGGLVVPTPARTSYRTYDTSTYIGGGSLGGLLAGKAKEARRGAVT